MQFRYELRRIKRQLHRPPPPRNRIRILDRCQQPPGSTAVRTPQQLRLSMFLNVFYHLCFLCLLVVVFAIDAFMARVVG